MDRYCQTGAKISALPHSDPASQLLDLIAVMRANQRFFGKYKSPLPNNAIVTESPGISIDKLAITLAERTNTDIKEAYKLLLKLNACKVACCNEDISYSNLHRENRYSMFSKDSPEYYKQGLDEVVSFADFLKKIEKSIAYLVSKAEPAAEDKKRKSFKTEL